MPNLIKYYVPVYSCEAVAEKFEDVVVMSKGRSYKVGGFTVQSLPVKHNTENYAYIIKHELLGKLIYAVDCEEFLYRIREVNHWIIEANNDWEVMFDHAIANEHSVSASENHLSIDQCVDVLVANKCDAMTTIVLAHLSDSNSDADKFVSKTRDAINIDRVFVADKGLDIELCKKMD